jgi:hypothetical protein
MRIESKSTAVLPRFESVSELVEFFDTHDMGKYAARMPEAHFEAVSRQEVRQAGAVVEQESEHGMERHWPE